ncbi:MAG: peptidyl-prolyl cis-trans isomerase [Pseudomonadales bacterium]|nr:peptidyl-prolyl cis-trans isomerase [Pseudomonadales bacterium]
MAKSFPFLILTLALLLLAVVAQADIRYDQLPDNAAFKINDRSFSQQAVLHLMAASQKHNPNLKANRLVLGLIENYLLVKHKGDLTLSKNFGIKRSIAGAANHAALGNHSAKSHDIGLNVQSLAEYQQLLDLIQPVKTEVDLTKLIVKGPDQQLEALKKVLAVNDSKAMINEDLTTKQINQTKDIPVLIYQFDGQQSVISFWDIFSSSNVHDRTRLRRVDQSVIYQKSLRILLRRYQEREIVRNTGWNFQDLEDLKRFVTDKVSAQAMLKNMGIIADLHHNTPTLQSFNRTVTEPEIEAYYQQHRDEFMQVSSVMARHITVKTQSEADKVYAALKSGLDFSEAVLKYSIDPDKNSSLPGSLGKIDKNDKGLEFRQKLALIQPVGEVSTPYRMLDGKSYEIFLVEEKLPEYLTLTDKSVRRTIISKLSQKNAATYLESFKTKLLEDSDIKINRIYQ